MRNFTRRSILLSVACLILLAVGGNIASAQTARTARDLGSQTARAGFRNESEIAAKFENFQTDQHAREWLRAIGYDAESVRSIKTEKPHGDKSDVVLLITTESGEKRYGISIKLVSSERGFNQIDKRWLTDYAKMWNMPDDIAEAMKYYVGETPPFKTSRDKRRMFLNEFEHEMRERMVTFFETNKKKIVTSLIKGSGRGSADLFMVAQRSGKGERWVIKSIDETIAYFAEGDVEMTRAGNLKIGRISMQRKGGDGGRPTANMLQFKLNPAELFDAK
ncbi:MAG: type II restriction endonuclease [Acidobacteria bacterium]|nr:type II restriction endonuclease [Acidobacteriota bacterium]